LKERFSSHAKEFDKTEIETEDSSRRQKAFQDHRERQNQTDAFRQAPLDGHQGSGPNAQAEEADAGQSQRRGRHQANAPLRLSFRRTFHRSSSFVFRFSTSCQAALHGCLPADKPQKCLPQGKQNAASNTIRDKPAALRVFLRVSAPCLSPNLRRKTHGTRKTRHKTPRPP
jgi:hypothetical protein